MGRRLPPLGGSSGDGERSFNGRVLLEQVAGEIRADVHPDPYEIGLAVSATADVLEVLHKASRSLGVDPPELANLRPWALTLIERATAPSRRRGLGW
jgi:hypothetical protein